MKTVYSNSLITILSLVILFSILSCSDNGIDSIDVSEPIVPLELNNYWTYEKIMLTTATNDEILLAKWVISCDSLPDITSDLDPQKVFLTNYIHASLGSPYIKYFISNLEDGLHILGSFSQNNSTYYDILKIKYPVEVGDSWSVDFPWYGETVVTCIDDSSQITTSLGVFTCYKFEYETRITGDDYFEQYLTHEYYYPGIGLVAIDKNRLSNQTNEINLIYKSRLIETNVLIPE